MRIKNLLLLKRVLHSFTLIVFFFLCSSLSAHAQVGQTIYLKGNNGKHVCSENGVAPMTCNRTWVDSWEKFTVVNAGGGKVALRGNNGKYVSSENGAKPITCNRTLIGSWEKFDLIHFSGNKFALRGNNGRYISSENGASPMTCNRFYIGFWEQFTWGAVLPIGGKIYLKGNNNKFVCSENGSGPMNCNRGHVLAWEKFTVVYVGLGKIGLRGNNGRYVSSENGASPITCNRTHLGTWEKFDVIYLSGNKIALKGNNGRYISSENGSKPMTCNRVHIGSWEIFNWGHTSKSTKSADFNEQDAKVESGLDMKSKSFTVFPIPVKNNILNIHSNTTSDIHVKLYNSLGQIVFNNELKGASTYEVQLSKVSKGYYILVLESGDAVETKKILIE